MYRRRSTSSPKAWVDKYVKQVDELEVEYRTLLVATAGLCCEKRERKSKPLLKACLALYASIRAAKNLDGVNFFRLSQRMFAMSCAVQGYIDEVNTAQIDMSTAPVK